MAEEIVVEGFSYRKYVTDARLLDAYNTYQRRYAETIRESDKVIVSMVHQVVEEAGDRRLRVLDIGCSTGNLLLHLKQLVPGADYVGGDLAESSLDLCRRNPRLAGIDFQRLDVLDLPPKSCDVVIVNAVLYMFDEDEYLRAVASLRRALRAAGRAILYDFAHPFEHQNVVIHETTVMCPEGIRLSFRPMKRVRRCFTEAGFDRIDFFPFNIPIDLPMPGFDKEVITYTINRKDGDRLMFRGTLFQPWCHMVAR